MIDYPGNREAGQPTPYRTVIQLTGHWAPLETGKVYPERNQNRLLLWFYQSHSKMGNSYHVAYLTGA